MLRAGACLVLRRTQFSDAVVYSSRVSHCCRGGPNECLHNRDLIIRPVLGVAVIVMCVLHIEFLVGESERKLRSGFIVAVVMRSRVRMRLWNYWWWGGGLVLVEWVFDGMYIYFLNFFLFRVKRNGERGRERVLWVIYI